ncbi:hypothetical protein ACFQWF_15520 [Methylorubrum suomiense]
MDDASAGLRQLLAVEAVFRRASDRDALGIALANECVKLVRARQGFLLRTDRVGGLAVERVSGTIQVERNAPLLAFVEAAVTAIPKAARAAPAASTSRFWTARKPGPIPSATASGSPCWIGPGGLSAACC